MQAHHVGCKATGLSNHPGAGKVSLRRLHGPRTLQVLLPPPKPASKQPAAYYGKLQASAAKNSHDGLSGLLPGLFGLAYGLQLLRTSLAGRGGERRGRGGGGREGAGGRRGWEGEILIRAENAKHLQPGRGSGFGLRFRV